MSREAFLLLTCIQSCGGRWGLNMPIDILRGSRVCHFYTLILIMCAFSYGSNVSVVLMAF